MGPLRVFATGHLPLVAGGRSQITLGNAGCERISGAVRGIFVLLERLEEIPEWFDVMYSYGQYTPGWTPRCIYCFREGA